MKTDEEARLKELELDVAYYRLIRPGISGLEYSLQYSLCEIKGYVINPGLTLKLSGTVERPIFPISVPKDICLARLQAQRTDVKFIPFTEEQLLHQDVFPDKAVLISTYLTFLPIRMRMHEMMDSMSV